MRRAVPRVVRSLFKTSAGYGVESTVPRIVVAYNADILEDSTVQRIVLLLVIYLDLPYQTALLSIPSTARGHWTIMGSSKFPHLMHSSQWTRPS